MLIRTCLALTIALLLAASISVGASASELSDLAAKTTPSVVLLTVEDSAGRKLGTGTGFFASTDGRIITNHHVIEGGAKITATLSDGSRRAILGVLASDERRDIAILAADGGASPALALGSSTGVRPGDEVVVIGSPRGLSGTLSVGIVSAIRAHGLGDEPDEQIKTESWGIQITAAISPGSSGSPIMTKSGEVVAVAVGTLNGAQALNFGVPIEVARGMLGEIGPNARPAPLGGDDAHDLRRNLIISGGIFGAIGLLFFFWGRSSRPRAPRSG
ncbi:MAG: trypsin-like peptidase domain-containing protein [Byssovorax sp.]